MNLEHETGDVRGACPLVCPDTCSWIVTVRQGEAVALRGDPDHPYTRGALCNKVADYLSYARSPDRLLYPLRRVGAKGSGEVTRISWGEALETIAARFRHQIETDGSEAIWPYAGSGNMGLIQGIYGAGERLWNVLGTSQHLVTICTIAGGFGTGYTLGDNRVGMDPETFRLSKLIVLWGANVLSTHPHLWRPILEARKNMTDTARYADIILPATMAIEHSDLLIAYGHLYISWNEPAVPPPGECLPATEMFRRLARAMGLDEPALYDSDEEIARQILDSDPGVASQIDTTPRRDSWPIHSKPGLTVNATVDDRESDMGRGAVYHDNRVRVERTA